MTEAEKQKWINSAVAVGILLLVTKFVKNDKVKAGALGAVGVIVATKLPVVNKAFVA